MRASDRAYLALREDILDGDLAPGAVLAEVEQATRLGVSRTPLREALGRLVADGLVASQAGRGLVVTDVSIDTIHELFELRRALDETAARLAAKRRDPDVFAALETEFREVPERLDGTRPALAAYYELVARLDTAIDAAVDNPHLVAALENLRTHLARIRRLAKDDHERLRSAAGEHLMIVQAIRSGDSDLAAHATHVHLHHALQHALTTTRLSSQQHKQQHERSAS